MLTPKTKVLLIEDDKADANYIKEMLQDYSRTQFEFNWKDRLTSGLNELARQIPDILLLDLSLPDSRGVDTVITATVKAPNVPVIVLTGYDDEQLAITAVKKGAQDYLVKGDFGARTLGRAINYAIERKKLINDLKEAWSRIKVLNGLIPICARCKNIRDDKGYWEQVETYIRKRSEAEFSHSICPKCARELYPEYFAEELDDIC